MNKFEREYRRFFKIDKSILSQVIWFQISIFATMIFLLEFL